MFGFPSRKNPVPTQRKKRAQLDPLLNQYQNQISQLQQQLYNQSVQQVMQSSAGAVWHTTSYPGIYNNSGASGTYFNNTAPPVDFKPKDDTKKLLTDILTDKLNAKR